MFACLVTSFHSCIPVLLTDNGIPAQFYEKTFTITVEDVNEVPTSVSLTGSKVFKKYFSHGWVSPSSPVLLSILVLRAHATRLS